MELLLAQVEFAFSIFSARVKASQLAWVEDLRWNRRRSKRKEYILENHFCLPGEPSADTTLENRKQLENVKGKMRIRENYERRFSCTVG
jgi:hypothetical protein